MDWERGAMGGVEQPPGRLLGPPGTRDWHAEAEMHHNAVLTM